jgi:hypothetical protein
MCCPWTCLLYCKLCCPGRVCSIAACAVPRSERERVYSTSVCAAPGRFTAACVASANCAALEVSACSTTDCAALDVSVLQLWTCTSDCAVPRHVYSTAACAVHEHVCFSASCAVPGGVLQPLPCGAPVHVCLQEFCAAPAEVSVYKSAWNFFSFFFFNFFPFVSKLFCLFRLFTDQKQPKIILVSQNKPQNKTTETYWTSVPNEFFFVLFRGQPI